MMEEEDWVKAMEDDPGNAVILGAFADWLDERNDPRAGLFRTLWEGGRVGVDTKAGWHRSYSYFSVAQPGGRDHIPDGLWRAATRMARKEGMDNGLEGLTHARLRMELAKAWAEADEATREKWRLETLSVEAANA